MTEILPKQEYRSRTPWQIMMIKLRKNKLAMSCFWFLVALYTLAIFAGFFSPYGYDFHNRDFGFHHPHLTHIHIFDKDGHFSRPFVYATQVEDPYRKVYLEDFSKKYPIQFFVRSTDPLNSYKVLGIFHSNLHLFGVEAPARIFLFGSDQFGRDLLSRIFFGSQISLSIGLVGITISMSLAMLIGGIAGYFGGRYDFTIMRFVEIILTIPSLYMILIMRQMFGDVKSTTSYLIIVIVLAFIGWASTSRVIRGMVLSLKEQEFVLAAQALGYSRMQIIIRDILPNTISIMIVRATLTIPYYILGEVALSFLGVGIQEPEASWGNMLSTAQNVRYLTDYPWIVASGFFIFAAVLAFNVFGDGLRDAADPRTLK